MLKTVNAKAFRYSVDCESNKKKERVNQGDFVSSRIQRIRHCASVTSRPFVPTNGKTLGIIPKPFKAVPLPEHEIRSVKTISNDIETQLGVPIIFLQSQFIIANVVSSRQAVKYIRLSPYLVTLSPSVIPDRLLFPAD